MVMNGPTPIMLDMLSAVAWSRPKRRSSGADVEGVAIGARFYPKPSMKPFGEAVHPTTRMLPLAMRYLPFVALAGMLASIGSDALGGARGAEPSDRLSNQPVVVELFTSEGCSSCPPADEWLRAIADGAVEGVPVVVLSEHVDYWNRLGWKDPFSSAVVTARQERYARSLSAELYTPQMVVDGEVGFVGSDRQATLTAIRRAAASKKAAIATDLAVASRAIEVRATVTKGMLDRLPDADVFVALAEDGLISNVAAGENAGRRLVHAAVSRYLEKIGQVKQDAASTSIVASIPVDPAWTLRHSRVIVLLQAQAGTKILGVWSGATPLDREARLEGR
jgi:hypothetical protein